MKKLLALVLIAALAATLASPAATSAGRSGVTLTLLHHSDAESRLLNAGAGLEDFGGVARFKTLVEVHRSGGSSGPDNVALFVGAGDNVLAGPQYQASVDKGPPYYDAIAARLLGYDAMAVGNHEFDFGPDDFAAYLCGLVLPGGGPSFDACGLTGRPAFPVVSANLDFSGEPALQSFVDAGLLVKSAVVTKGEHRFGIVGATTPQLPFISSPGNVYVDPRIAQAVQAEVDLLEKRGINKIVLVSHLEGLDFAIALAKDLRGVDIVVTGGGGELLADPNDLLVPGDRIHGSRPYPIYATGADGVSVPVVTTPPGYTYLGKLVVEFDAGGNLTWVDPSSGPIRVAGPSVEGGVNPDPIVHAAVERPVASYVEKLGGVVMASTEVALDGRPSQVQTRETNLGDFLADAVLWQANALASEAGTPLADVALINGGSIRELQVLEPGALTLLNTYEMVPFPNFISLVEDVSPAVFKRLMENSVSQLPRLHGRFAQVAGFTVVYDLAGAPMTFDVAGNIVDEGSRVVSIQLDDGTWIVRDGAVVPGAPSVNVATLNFLARGGDQYPFDSGFVNLDVSHREAVESYVTHALEGVVRAAQYPEGGSGRIVFQ